MLPLDTETLVLRPAKRKFIQVLVFCIVFAGVGVLMVLSGRGIVGWFCASVFAVGAIAFAVQILPGAFYLRLTPQGFVVCSFFRVVPTIPWRNVSEFRVKLIAPAMAKYVVFDQPRALDRKRLRQVNRALAGGEEMIPDTYGMTATELAELMNTWRTRFRC